MYQRNVVFTYTKKQLFALQHRRVNNDNCNKWQTMNDLLKLQYVENGLPAKGSSTDLAAIEATTILCTTKRVTAS